MPYQLVHRGIVREFEFYPPVGWPYWHKRGFDEDNRRGLPLIVALHGGGQAPETLAANWPFPLLFNSADNANWEDRAFVLYPYGFSYVPDLAGRPLRGWNTGFSGTYLSAQDDVGFVQAMIDAVEKMLRRELRAIGFGGPPIDPDRRYLFGYSMGAMMSYRLTNEMSNHWAAIWAMSGTYGGRSHANLTPTITYSPQGQKSVSLFAHHGELDIVVPPGPLGDPSGLMSSTISRDLYVATGLLPNEADDYASSVRHLAAAAVAFRTHNNCRLIPFEVLEPPTSGQPDTGGTNLSIRTTYRQETNPPNPEVITYRDPLMDHTNFVPNRYFDASDVWDFFKNHPRTDL